MLPPLNIKGTCRVQRLPTVSIDGPNAHRGTHDMEFGTIDNNRYIQIIHEERGKPKEIATPIAELPLNIAVSQQTNEIPRVDTPKHNALAITATSTDSYGEDTIRRESSSTYFTNTEDESIKTTETAYSSAFEAIQTSSSAAEGPTGTSRTDDEKIRHASRPGPHKVHGKKTFAVTRQRPKSKLSAQKTVIPVGTVVASAQQQPVYSDSVIKIIEEIFEATPHQHKVCEPPQIVHDLQSSKATTNDPVPSPLKDRQSIGIQTKPKLSACHHQLETIAQTPQSTYNSLVPRECSGDIEPASEEHVRITQEVFGQIRERKSERYRLRSSVANLTQRIDGVLEQSPTTQDHCQHVELINQLLMDTFAKYPDLKKYFVPAQPQAITVPGADCNDTLVSGAAVSKTLPSVRLENLRKRQQQQLKNQELLVKHPQLQRTIDSIRRDAVVSAATGRQHTSVIQSERSTDEVQEAARRFLNSVRSPKKQQYIQNTVQAEVHQRNTATTSNSSENGTDLFCTESSLKCLSSNRNSKERDNQIHMGVPAPLLCTASGSTQCSRSPISSITADDVISSVVISSRKETLQTTNESVPPVETTSTTSKHMSSSAACSDRGTSQSTTSSLEKFIQ